MSRRRGCLLVLRSLLRRKSMGSLAKVFWTLAILALIAPITLANPKPT